jgi:hypothetical protein
MLILYQSNLNGGFISTFVAGRGDPFLLERFTFALWDVSNGG